MIIVQSLRLSGLGEVATAKSAQEMALELLPARITLLGELKPLLEKWANYLPAKYEKTWKKAGFVDQMITGMNSLLTWAKAAKASAPEFLTLVPALNAASVDESQLKTLLRQIQQDNTPQIQQDNTPPELEDQINSAIDSAIDNPAMILLGLAALGAVVLLVNRR